MILWAFHICIISFDPYLDGSERSESNYQDPGTIFNLERKETQLPLKQVIILIYYLTATKVSKAASTKQYGKLLFYQR